MDRQAGNGKADESRDRAKDGERDYILLPGNSEYSGRFRFISEEEPPRDGSDNVGDRAPAGHTDKK